MNGIWRRIMHFVINLCTRVEHAMEIVFTEKRRVQMHLHENSLLRLLNAATMSGLNTTDRQRNEHRPVHDLEHFLLATNGKPAVHRVTLRAILYSSYQIPKLKYGLPTLEKHICRVSVKMHKMHYVNVYIYIYYTHTPLVPIPVHAITNPLRVLVRSVLAHCKLLECPCDSGEGETASLADPRPSHPPSTISEKSLAIYLYCHSTHTRKIMCKTSGCTYAPPRFQISFLVAHRASTWHKSPNVRL